MNITAKVIQASLNYETGTTIWTYELEYPRYIHAEFMTHRMFLGTVLVLELFQWPVCMNKFVLPT